MNRFILPSVFVCLFGCNYGASIHSSRIGDEWPGTMPLVDEIVNLVGKKCDLKNASKLYEEAKMDNRVCVTSLMNRDEYNNDIAAITSYNVNVFVEKYSKKLPKIKECYRIFTSTVDVCLDKGERETFNIWMNLTENFYAFALLETELYYSEKDPGCLKRKATEVLECYDLSFSRYMPSGETNLNNMPALKFEEGQCQSMTKLEKCVLAKLEKCSNPPTTNLVKSFFDTMCQSSPCSKFKSVQIPEENSPMEDTPKSPTLVTALAIFDLYRMASNRH